jgi:hypothetical protein
LVEFAKTRELGPGEKQNLKVSVKKSELASYDANSSLTYILDEGNYYFTAAKDAHSAINNILSHALQAFGYPLFTSISSISFTLGFRVLWMLMVYPKFPTINTIMLCYLVSWVLNMILYATFFTVVYRRYTKKGICKKI